MPNYSPIFEGMSDPRHSNATRHNLHEMLMIALLSVISGGETGTDRAQYGRFKEDFLRVFMALKQGLSIPEALPDLFNCIAPRDLGQTLARLSVAWVEGLNNRLREDDITGDVLAFDGQALRPSCADETDRQTLPLVHAFSAGTQWVLLKRKSTVNQTRS